LLDHLADLSNDKAEIGAFDSGWIQGDKNQRQLAVIRQQPATNDFIAQDAIDKAAVGFPQAVDLETRPQELDRYPAADAPNR